MPTGTPSGDDAADEVAHLARHADADRVGEHDLVRARCDDPRGELGHAAGVDGALERAAERDADRDGRADAVRGRALEDPLRRPRRSPRRTRAALRWLNSSRGREREVHLVEPGLAQPVVAPLVQGEARVDDALAPLDRRDDLLRAGHLRHGLRADEADGLDARHAGGGEQVDELRAHGRARA